MARGNSDAKGCAALVLIAIAAPFVIADQCRERREAQQVHRVQFRVRGADGCRASVGVHRNYTPSYSDHVLPWQSTPAGTLGSRNSE